MPAPTPEDVRRMARNIRRRIRDGQRIAPKLWSAILRGQEVDYDAWARYALEHNETAPRIRDFIGGSRRLTPPVDEPPAPPDA